MCDYIETDDIHSGNGRGLLEVNGVTVGICHGVNVQRLSSIPSLVDEGDMIASKPYFHGMTVVVPYIHKG